MPVICSPWYSIEQLRAHPKWMFLYGDNVTRKGLGGQAGACRYQSNAIGVRTKWAPSMRPQAFFGDNDYERCAVMIDEDLQQAFAHVAVGLVVVVPMNGIGTGYAHLEDRAPRLFQHLQARIKTLVRYGQEQPLPPFNRITAPQANQIQDAARTGHHALIWTVYDGTEEFPREYVAKPSASTAVAPMMECLVDAKLDHLRQRLPGGLSSLTRAVDDAPGIVETWF